MPSWRHFDEQPKAYKDALLPNNVFTVSIEAGTTLGWQKYVGRDGLSIGIDTFGVSAPAVDAFDHFELDAQSIARRVKGALEQRPHFGMM
jgi:transketolase